MPLSFSTRWGLVMCCQPACSPWACHCSGSELRVPASCQLVSCVWWCGCVHMYVCMLPSEHFVDAALQCQWHIERVRWDSPGFPRAVFTPSVYSPKHTLKSITSLFLSFPLFFHSLYFSLIYSWLLLTCRFKSGAVRSSGGVPVDSRRSSLPQREAGLSFSLSHRASNV